MASHLGNISYGSEAPAGSIRRVKILPSSQKQRTRGGGIFSAA